MNKYLIRTLFAYYLVEADSPGQAWTLVMISNYPQYATDREELRQKLLTQGFTRMMPTEHEQVFELN